MPQIIIDANDQAIYAAIAATLAITPRAHPAYTKLADALGTTPFADYPTPAAPARVLLTTIADGNPRVRGYAGDAAGVSALKTAVAALP